MSDMTRIPTQTLSLPITSGTRPIAMGPDSSAAVATFNLCRVRAGPGGDQEFSPTSQNCALQLPYRDMSVFVQIDKKVMEERGTEQQRHMPVTNI